MVSHLFYYQLALLAIIWLFVMLHLTGSKPGLPTPPVPAKPKRKRSPEPKAFEGLTHKPHCMLCAQETGKTHPPVGPKYWNTLFSPGLQFTLNRLASLNFALL
jgi:hypothetical protein